MKRQIIRVEPLSSYLERWKAPASVMTRHGDTRYVSGLPPFDPDTGEVVNAPIERQTQLALEQMKLCLETGADVNAANSMGITAVIGAANRGSDDIIQFLAQRGAKLDVKDKEGRTPLVWAKGVFLATNSPTEKPGDLYREAARRTVEMVDGTEISVALRTLLLLFERPRRHSTTAPTVTSRPASPAPSPPT